MVCSSKELRSLMVRSKPLIRGPRVILEGCVVSRWREGSGTPDDDGGRRRSKE